MTILQIPFIFNKQIVIYRSCFWDVMILPMVCGAPAASEQAPSPESLWVCPGCSRPADVVGNLNWGQALALFSPWLCPAVRERDKKHWLWFEKLHSDFCLWFGLVWEGFFVCFGFIQLLYPFFSPWKTRRLSRATFRNPLNIPKLRICLWCIGSICIWMESCLTPINHLQIKCYTEFVIMNMNFSWYTETEYIWALVCMNSSWSH